MSVYTFKTSPHAIVAVLRDMVASTAKLHEFAPGPAWDAAMEAATLRLLKTVGNGMFEVSGHVEAVLNANDPVAELILMADMQQMFKLYGQQDGRGK